MPGVLVHISVKPNKYTSSRMVLKKIPARFEAVVAPNGLSPMYLEWEGR